MRVDGQRLRELALPEHLHRHAPARGEARGPQRVGGHLGALVEARLEVARGSPAGCGCGTSRTASTSSCAGRGACASACGSGSARPRSPPSSSRRSASPAPLWPRPEVLPSPSPRRGRPACAGGASRGPASGCGARCARLCCVRSAIVHLHEVGDRGHEAADDRVVGALRGLADAAEAEGAQRVALLRLDPLAELAPAGSASVAAAIRRPPPRPAPRPRRGSRPTGSVDAPAPPAP